ncbi:sodium-dependent transporter [Campylobacter sp. MIT 21-1685]|uniref:sodium-dependent transporter n=1 Tax=unclassified Campylobacter TaxID=2593542 RepID=UPI00224A76C5|nr:MULTISPECIES: sodium-dependent transporter [unclassified Campylobacter]MCX2682286.1 sodium-dependent transporter [Campylobacter sp. MIT 21-1684]MCX2750566.1 sodium-dependent transporter [Campylobacter sp. MIT 21-1682]MCX2806886.1 sodium-dependent transporter [Campylobacter sp. MIT 21-1685]
MRHSWSNTLTYILVTAGATIGFGATWRFPYLVGTNGGGAYVCIFIVAMILIGIPMILVENVIGRKAQKNALDAFDPNFQRKEFSKLWKIIGYIGLIGCFGIIAYYMVLGGWVFTYIFHIFSGSLDLSIPIDKEITQRFYSENIEHNPLFISFYTLLFVVLNYCVLVRGISQGIEKAMKLLMPLLALCLVAVVLRNLTLEGASKGIIFYLYPDFSKISAKVFLEALGQVFFALSLGFAVMITLSSYLNRNENLVKTAVTTGFINTLIALLAGFMIFPSLFTFDLEPSSGPRLVFEVLPIVFSKMYFGAFFALSFFILLLTAAFTTSITLYEPLITVIEEKFGFGRKKAVFLVLVCTFFLGNLPCILAYGPWREVMIFGRNIFDTFDFISGNIFFVLTALGTSIFVGWVLQEDAKKELLQGFQKKNFVNLWFYYVKYIVPVIICAIFISGIV